MKKVLLYCPSLNGHRLEYLHHLYVRACSNLDVEYIVVVSAAAVNRFESLIWPQSDNVKVIPHDGIDTSSSSIVIECFEKCKKLGKVIKKYSPMEVIVLDLIEYVLFLPFFVRGRIKVSGIVYRIFLYDWKNESLAKKMQDWIKYFLFSHCGVFHKVFILNDSASADVLNRIFKSNKFCFLPDPIAQIERIQNVNIRKKYNISNNKTIYLHPGGMMAYKGTIEILEALLLLDEDNCKNICIIFAGRVTPEIQPQFNDLIQLASKRIQIVFESGFISFDYLGALFYASDWVLIPYKTKAQSSGILGHAAFFRKPVITVEGGLIGNITKRNHLGVTIPSCSPKSIADVIKNPPKWEYSFTDYVDRHTIDNFTSIILNDKI